MLTRLLETAANAADAAQSGSNGADLTQLTNILDWVMIVLLPAVALYLFYTVFRLRRDRVLFDNKLLYPGGCTKDDCLDPDGFIDYILPRLIIIGVAFLLCGAFTALVVFVPAMDTLVCNILEIVFPIAAAYAANPGDLSWDEFAALGELTVYDRTAQEDAAARIGDAEVVFINKVRLTDEIFAACPNLKLVSILATGYNIVDLAAAKRRGITVCNVPGYSTRAVVQMTFALLLEICQQVGLHSGAVHTGRWQTCPDFCFWDRPLIELDGKTMGIVGYGAIGSAVGAVAQALGMKLLVTARHEKPVPEGARFVSLPELLAQSDVVSLHCPQTAENARMIDAGALAQMKDGAILLNTARGGLLDEQAVADALRSGKLLAAGMDVVSAEPIRADNPLLTAPNCFLTPHIAWAPLETRRRLQAISAENLRAFLAGKPQNVVNP